jgi:lipopolysaccharide export system protein LptC
MIRASGWMPLAGLALVAGLSWWLAQLVSELPDATGVPVAPQADGIIDDFVARSLDPEGNVRYVLTARQMTHYPKTETSALVQVKIESFAPQQPRLTVTADRGIVRENGDIVTLERNVRVQRDPGADSEPLTVLTDTLTAYPDTGKFTTRSEVVAATPTMQARSQGLDYDHTARLFRLYRVNATIDSRKARS